jgi:hypothetical protein
MLVIEHAPVLAYAFKYLGGLMDVLDDLACLKVHRLDNHLGPARCADPLREGAPFRVISEHPFLEDQTTVVADKLVARFHDVGVATVRASGHWLLHISSNGLVLVRLALRMG